MEQLLKSIIMKKVILCSFAVVLAAGTYLLASDKTGEGALLLSNVEALARSEGATSTWTCDASSKKECSLFCGECGTRVKGTGAASGKHECD